MDTKFALKYGRIKQILNDVAGCAAQQLVLVGGTALALFYLHHRVSVDLDLKNWVHTPFLQRNPVFQSCDRMGHTLPACCGIPSVTLILSPYREMTYDTRNCSKVA